MDDFAEPAVAEPVAVSEPQETEQQQDATPNEAEPKEPRRSRREALEKAFSDVDKEDDKGGSDADVKPKVEAKTEPKAEPKKAEPKAEKPTETKTEGQERGPDGKFVSKEATDKPAEAQEAAKAPEPKGKLTDPPSRFSEDAKKAWAEAPESVRAETYRAIRETEQGIQKYQQALEPLKPFMQMAQNDPRKLAGAMQRYVNTEQMLAKNPVQGFAEIARNMGLSPQQVGKMLMGEEPGQADPRDAEINQLRQQVQQLSQGYGQVTQTIQEQRQQAVLSQVEQFAQAHPRFDELADEIANMLSTNYAKDLQDAYEKADRLNPAPAPVVQEEPPAQPAQTRPARSVTGAPTSGSNPVNRKPSNSRKEALEQAMRRAGF